MGGGNSLINCHRLGIPSTWTFEVLRDPFIIGRNSLVTTMRKYITREGLRRGDGSYEEYGETAFFASRGSLGGEEGGVKQRPWTIGRGF